MREGYENLSLTTTFSFGVTFGDLASSLSKTLNFGLNKFFSYSSKT